MVVFNGLILVKMAHYALITEENIVALVITGVDESEQTPEGFDSWEDWYANHKKYPKCKRASYNTRENKYYIVDEFGEYILGDDQTKAFRGNYPGSGDIYDEENDVFYPLQPYESWILDENIWNWVAPISKPEGYENTDLEWNEGNYQEDNTQGWIIPSE